MTALLIRTVFLCSCVGSSVRAGALHEHAAVAAEKAAPPAKWAAAVAAPEEKSATAKGKQTALKEETAAAEAAAKEAETTANVSTDTAPESQATSTTPASAAKNTTDAIYDSDGWHLHTDMIAEVIHPGRLPPFWVLPFLVSAKLILTTTAFGTVWRFEPDSLRSNTTYLKGTAKLCLSLVFIAMALNSYIVDYYHLKESWDRVEGFWNRAVVCCAVLVTSANIIAAKAINDTLGLDDPVLFFDQDMGVREHVSRAFGYGFCGYRFFLQKWVWRLPVRTAYWFILWPYSWIGGLSLWPPLVSAGMWLVCSGGCSMMWKACCVIQCKFMWVLLLTILSLGFWSYPRETVVESWGLVWPGFYYSAVYFWATGTAPHLIFTVFACVHGYSCEMVHQLELRGFSLDARTKAALMELNRDLLPEEDYQLLVDASAQPQQQVEEASAQSVGMGQTHEQLPPGDFGTAKLRMFWLKNMTISQFVFQQFAVLVLLRASYATNPEGLIAVTLRTATERTFVDYGNSLRDCTNGGIKEAVNIAWMLR